MASLHIWNKSLTLYFRIQSPTWPIPVYLLYYPYCTLLSHIYRFTFCSLNILNLFLFQRFRFCCFVNLKCFSPKIFTWQSTSSFMSQITPYLFRYVSWLSSTLISTKPTPHSVLVSLSLSYISIYILITLPLEYRSEFYVLLTTVFLGP